MGRTTDMGHPLSSYVSHVIVDAMKWSVISLGVTTLAMATCIFLAALYDQFVFMRISNSNWTKWSAN